MNTKRVLCIVTLTILAVLTFVLSAAATDEIVIENITFGVYTDANGVESNDLSLAKLKVSIPDGSEQMTILLSTEEINELGEATIPKIIYLNQIKVPADGTFEFPVEKSRILDAIGDKTAETTTLYLKVGATAIDTPASTETVMEIQASRILYGDVNDDKQVNSIDFIYLSRHLAEWDGYPLINPVAANLDSDEKITSIDSAILARHLAKWSGYIKLPFEPIE